MKPATTLFHLVLDRMSRPGSALGLAFVQRTGTDRPQRRCRGRGFAGGAQRPRPGGGPDHRRLAIRAGFDILTEADSFALNVQAASWAAVVRVAAITPEIAAEIANQIPISRSRAKAAIVKVAIWHGGNRGGTSTTRPLTVIAWADIRHNYAAQVGLGRGLERAGPRVFVGNRVGI
jgi:hypothetical protein